MNLVEFAQQIMDKEGQVSLEEESDISPKESSSEEDYNTDSSYENDTEH